MTRTALARQWARCSALLALAGCASAATPASPSSDPTPGVGVGVSVSAPASAAHLQTCPPGMAAVPGGRFTLGEVAREALIQPFCLDVTEVTVDAFRACIARGDCSASEVDSEYFLGKSQGGVCNFANATRGTHPMNCVNWQQAMGYCKAQGGRLPTEAEWEWAARGGGEARAYPWGSSAPGERACWRDTGAVEIFAVEALAARNGTCAVASQAGDKGRFGHHDLAANVAEWTADLQRQEPAIPITRGGSWLLGAPSTLRASFREPTAGTTRMNRLGFRCAK